MSKKNDADEIKKLVHENPDFIISAKYKNSLEAFVKRKPDGADNNTVAKLLGLKGPEEVERIYQESVEMIRKNMGVEIEE